MSAPLASLSTGQFFFLRGSILLLLLVLAPQPAHSWTSPPTRQHNNNHHNNKIGGGLNNMWDFLAPARYFLEKRVAGQSIPNVSNLSGRRKIQDYLGHHRDDSTKAKAEHAADADADGSLSTSTTTFDHSLWTQVLQRHVSTGHTFGSVCNVNAVDYEGMACDPDFERYLDLLEAAHPDKLDPLEQLAFWMNAYNALCIATIVHHEKTGTATTTAGMPLLSSITQLSTLEKGPVWDQPVPGRQLRGLDVTTLNAIEHSQLRAVWAEPAVHACIVCASASCPNLRTEAFEAPKLLDQMTDQMKDWLRNPTKGLCLTNNNVAATTVASPSSSEEPSSTAAGGGRVTLRSVLGGRLDTTGTLRLELSRIFLWFADDFGGREGLTEWLPQFVDDPNLINEDTLGMAAWRYFEYDWQINRASTRPSQNAAPSSSPSETTATMHATTTEESVAVSTER